MVRLLLIPLTIDILSLGCISVSAFSPPIRSQFPTMLRSSSPEGEETERQLLEFAALEPLPLNAAREERLAREAKDRAQFVNFGDQLWDLREDIDRISLDLLQAINSGATSEEEEARAKLRVQERKDPELVYMIELYDLQEAMNEGRLADALDHQRKAEAARSCLPQYNLDGLWVGKYGGHGYELINVTYAGDTLIAEKITGDQNVPRGQISFQVDLNPLRAAQSEANLKQREESALQPIKLTDKATKKWGTSQLPRYAGLGQVAEEGFKNHQWIDGQLIIIGEEYFSFAFVPIETQIFFGRPSPELALKMLRECSSTPFRKHQVFDRPPSVDDDVATQTTFASQCLEVTREIEDEITGYNDGNDTMGCIWHSDSEECYFE